MPEHDDNQMDRVFRDAYAALMERAPTALTFEEITTIAETPSRVTSLHGQQAGDDSDLGDQSLDRTVEADKERVDGPRVDVLWEDVERPAPLETGRWSGVAIAVVAAILVVVGVIVVADGNGGDVVTEPASSPAATESAPLPSVADPVTSPGVGDGQTVSVVVSGLSGHVGHDLAGVLYEEDQLVDLDLDPVGGFWSVVATDDFTTTEVVRDLGPLGEGRFPFVSDGALIVEPGTYTLVLWVDVGLNPAYGWVPINTDGRGLFGCQVVFDVTDEAQTEIVVPANLHPDGWNTNCVDRP
jgi:hypothetical protein